jgi:hypothetical protein
MRVLQIGAVVFAQQSPETSNVPWDQIKFVALLGAVLALFAAWAGVNIVSKANKQNTSDAVSIGTRVFIGSIVFAAAPVIIGIAAVLINWSGLAPKG